MCVCVCVCVCAHVCVGGDNGRLVTRICLEKKVSDTGAKGQGEGPARSLEHWLRCQLHNLTWDHCLLLIIIYEGLSVINNSFPGCDLF